MAREFSWIPIHREAIRRILTYRENQEELLNVLREMKQAGLRVISLEDRDSQGHSVPLAEIDPFTFLATFNRGVTASHRQDNWDFLKRCWALQASVPQDFTGIPVLNPLRAWLFPYAAQREGHHVGRLWDVASQVVSGDIDGVDRGLFDSCLGLACVGIGNLTIGMFWACPQDYLPADKKTRAYANAKGVQLEPRDYASYRQWMKDVAEQVGHDYPRISHTAHLFATQGKNHNDPPRELTENGDRRYWILAVGHGAEYWDEFYEQGIIAIGWNVAPDPDLREFRSKEEIRQRLSQLEPGSRKTNDALAFWQFVHGIKKGDIIFAKQGFTKLLGYGVVEGDYEFDAQRTYYRHVRKVKWRTKGQWEMPTDSKLPLKTLTDITHDPDVVAVIGGKVGLKPPAEGQIGAAVSAPDGITSSTQAEPYDKKKAMHGLFLTEPQFDSMLTSLREKKNIVLQGAPGVGKTYVAKRLAYALIGSSDPQRVEMIQFHQSYCYEDFVQGFRPEPDGRFELRHGVFYQFCRRAQREETRAKPYVFIIDEINRGNLSKIFGELMMLIEPDKRGREYTIPLAYSPNTDERFYVPENLYLIGMMNTADRSLAMVDYALRRRFRFVTLRPEFTSTPFHNFLIAAGATTDLVEKIVSRMTALNEIISADTKNLGPGYQIGHSYFCPQNGTTPDEQWYRRVIDAEIVPLIQEYWFDDEQKVKDQHMAMLA